MNEKLAELLGQTERNPGVSEVAIQKVIAYAGVPLPDDYLDFLRSTNGAEGPVGADGYLVLYSAEDVLINNESYEAGELYPGLLLIGGTGDNTAYAIDTRATDPTKMEFVQLSLVGYSANGIEGRFPTLLDLVEHAAVDELDGALTGGI